MFVQQKPQPFIATKHSYLGHGQKGLEGHRGIYVFHVMHRPWCLEIVISLMIDV